MNNQEAQIPLYERIPNNGEIADWLSIGTLNGVVKRQLMRNDLIHVGNEGEMIIHDKQTASYRIKQSIALEMFSGVNEDVDLSINLPNVNHRQNSPKGDHKGVDYIDRNGIGLSFKSNGHNLYNCELYPGTADKKIREGKEEKWMSLTNSEVRLLVKLIETGITDS